MRAAIVAVPVNFAARRSSRAKRRACSSLSFGSSARSKRAERERGSWFRSWPKRVAKRCRHRPSPAWDDGGRRARFLGAEVSGSSHPRARARHRGRNTQARAFGLTQIVLERRGVKAITGHELSDPNAGRPSSGRNFSAYIRKRSLLAVPVPAVGGHPALIRWCAGGGATGHASTRVCRSTCSTLDVDRPVPACIFHARDPHGRARVERGGKAAAESDHRARRARVCDPLLRSAPEAAVTGLRRVGERAHNVEIGGRRPHRRRRRWSAAVDGDHAESPVVRSAQDGPSRNRALGVLHFDAHSGHARGLLSGFRHRPNDHVRQRAPGHPEVTKLAGRHPRCLVRGRGRRHEQGDRERVLRPIRRVARWSGETLASPPARSSLPPDRVDPCPISTARSPILSAHWHNLGGLCARGGDRHPARELVRSENASSALTSTRSYQTRRRIGRMGWERRSAPPTRSASRARQPGQGRAVDVSGVRGLTAGVARRSRRRSAAAAGGRRGH